MEMGAIPSDGSLLERLAETPIGQVGAEALRVIEVVQETVAGLLEQEGQEALLLTKAGTVLVLALLEKAASGKSPRDFAADDWKDLATAVSWYAVIAEGQDYAAFVFSLYARFNLLALCVLPTLLIG